MAHEDNKTLIENYTRDIWTEHNVDNLEEYIADNYVEHTPFGTFHGLDEFRGYINMVLRGMSDFEVTIDNVVADENMVASNYTTEGTHDGEFLGADPTGNRAASDGCYVGRVENGMLAEGWNQFDLMTVLSELEILPSETLGQIRQGANFQRGR